MPDAPLQIDSLGFHYEDAAIFNGVDLTVQQGEFVALLGPSGCGKSTLLRSIAGLATPQQGQITLNGTLVCSDGRNHVGTEDRGVGLVFQEYALFPHMTVTDNVAFGLQTPDADRVAHVLELVGMAHLGERKPSGLSGGQQQRVALARALAPRPALLLLDEPFANIDAVLRESLSRELLRVVRQEGTSALLVTHDQHSALSLADRVVILDGDEAGATILQDASAQQVYQQPATEAVAALTGECTVIDAVAHGEFAETDIGNVPLTRPRTGAIRLVLRPHQVRFIPDEAGAFRLSDVRYTGTTYRLSFEGPCMEIEAEAEGSQSPPAVGTSGRLEAQMPCWSF